MSAASPDQERGVAFSCAHAAECDALLAELAEYFSARRFLNLSAAFDEVKHFVAQRALTLQSDKDAEH